MGKFPTSLLSIVVQLCLIEGIFADDQVRRVQEELRKRHLFYGEITGEITPALTVAISGYQQKKGFPRTGQLDPGTLASLGLMKAPVQPPQFDIPFVLDDTGGLRGANGEALLDAPVPYRPNDAAVADFTATEHAAEGAVTGPRDDAASLIKQRRLSNAHPLARSRPSQPRKETNPFVRAFNSVDRAIKQLVGDARPRKKRAVASRL